MKIIMCSLVFSIAMFFASPTFGQTEFYDLGQGNYSCGTWTVDRQASGAAAAIDEAWVLGCLSGFSLADSVFTKKSNTVATDNNGIFGWIDNHCKINPTENLASASLDFWLDSNAVKFSAPSTPTH
jgi:hypothetical protein